ADACTGQDPELAGQLRAEIQRSADQWEAEDATLGSAAIALSEAHPEVAGRMAERLAGAARTALRKIPPEVLREGGRGIANLPMATADSSAKLSAVHHAVRALAWTGRIAAARKLYEQAEPALIATTRVDLRYTLAQAHARAGQAPATWAELLRIWELGNAEPRALLPGLAASVVEPLAVGCDELDWFLEQAGQAAPAQAQEMLATFAAELAAGRPRAAEQLAVEAERLAMNSGATPSDLTLGNLAQALAALGLGGDAEWLAQRFTDAWAGARVRAAAAGELAAADPATAQRLAIEAASSSVIRAVAFKPFRRDESPPNPLEVALIAAAAEACARAGSRAATKQAVELAHLLLTEEASAQRLSEGQPLVAWIAGALWPHAPVAAGRLTDRVMRSIQTEGPYTTTVLELAALFTGVEHHDPERATGLLAALPDVVVHDTQEILPQYETALALMAVRADRAAALQYLDTARRNIREQSREPDLDRIGSLALTQAALGQYDEARASAGELPEGAERSKVFALLAGLLTGTDTAPLDARPQVTLPNVLATVQRLAGGIPPERSPAHTVRARALLAEVLSDGEGWHYALPALARLDATALLRARAVVFSHLGGGPDPESAG
ncbi:hypothetical protein P8605_06410, partial [Streptomyces sp. T-3]|nr:hypothetical protein [Streptomyces sp. T-3]